jgi:hypothetical protein
MSVFDRIKAAIFGRAEAAEPPKPSIAPTAQSPMTGAAQPATKVSNAPTPTPTTSPTPQTSVDVAAVMDAAVKANGQKLNWRNSIVDMMKALDLDSSLANRKALAKELNYTGDGEDSSKMNIWLHKALMQKLAANGGKVPSELTD